MGGSLIVAASFNFLLTPMMSDLGLSKEDSSIALAIPSTASLLIVFVAGRLGDRRGHRKVITWMGVLFILGCALVMLAQGLALLVIGLLFAGLAATSIQIVVFGLLSDCYPDPSSRARAFGTFGMVSPFAWMVFPVLTGYIVGIVSWRVVPLIWVLVGVVMVFAARFFLPPAREVESLGEVRTPILAGLTVVFLVQALSMIGNVGLISWWVLLLFVLAAGSALSCWFLLRSNRVTSFSLQPLRIPRARLLLWVVVIIPLINTVFLMTIAFQYLWGLSVLQTALIMVPAQAAAMLGTRLIAGPLMRRIGVTKTAVTFFSLLAVAMLCSFVMTPSSPLWVPALYVLVYNVLTVAASITVSSGLMSTANDQNSGEVSAFRGSGAALGQVLAVVLMNSAVFLIAQAGMLSELEMDGDTAAQATSTMQQLADGADSPSIMTSYSMELPSGTASVDDVLRDTFANGLHINGVLGALLSAACVVLVLRSARNGTREKVGARRRSRHDAST